MVLISEQVYEKMFENFSKGDWESALELQCSLKQPYFLWPKPRKCHLNFIVSSLKTLNITNILSIGCGCGLLEWLLSASSGIKVLGVEIDEFYWKSKYAQKNFVNMVFPHEESFSENIVNKKNALLFCYFNNRNAFLNYLSIYPGKCIIIIGPENCGKHSEPSPFDINIPREWDLWKSIEISDTRDYIAIYVKSKNLLVASKLSNGVLE